MNIPKTLRTIADQLRAEAEEPEVSRDALYLAVQRLQAQAEMLEQGLDRE